MPDPLVQTIHRDPALLYSLYLLKWLRRDTNEATSYWILFPITVVMVIRLPQTPLHISPLLNIVSSHRY